MFERQASTVEWRNYFGGLIATLHDTTERALCGLGDTAKKIENELETQRSLFVSEMLPQIKSDIRNFFSMELEDMWRRMLPPMEKKLRGGEGTPRVCEMSTQTLEMENASNPHLYVPKEKNWRGGADCSRHLREKDWRGTRIVVVAPRKKVGGGQRGAQTPFLKKIGEGALHNP